jgi:hypothetical protein
MSIISVRLDVTGSKVGLVLTNKKGVINSLNDFHGDEYEYILTSANEEISANLLKNFIKINDGLYIIGGARDVQEIDKDLHTAWDKYHNIKN